MSDARTRLRHPDATVPGKLALTRGSHPFRMALVSCGCFDFTLLRSQTSCVRLSRVGASCGMNGRRNAFVICRLHSWQHCLTRNFP